MRHQSPSRDQSEQPPNQFYSFNPATSEYRQLFAAPQFSAPEQASSSLAPLPSQFCTHTHHHHHPHLVHVPAQVPVPVPIAVGPAPAVAPAVGTHYNLPTDTQRGGGGGRGGGLLAAHPQLDHGLELHHLRPQQLPQHRRRHQQHLHQIHLQRHTLPRFPTRLMTMEDPNQHDMAAQQEAAKGYQPTLDGPVVGGKIPIAAIVDEYAKADPVYVEKTIALPQTYIHYRPIAGDGNCGWRAIGFSYFEKLVEGGDTDQVEGEVARLMSMNPLLASVGGYEYYEDWADEAIGLLRELADCVTDKDKAQALIHQRWTDTATGGALIYYLRLLSATYLKANSGQYDPYVPDNQGIQWYCSQSIELPDREIEHLGIIALVNCLLKPVNFVLEIAYLDRSPGPTVNVYRFPEEAIGKEVADLGPIIYLLYRPDHYDILYRRGPLPPAGGNLAPITMQINRATNVYSHTPITSTHSSLGAFSTTDFGLLASLPSAPASVAPPLPSQPRTHVSACSPYAPESQWMPSFPSTASLGTAASLERNLATTSAPPAQAVVPPGPRPTGALPSSPESECNIRFSALQYDYDYDYDEDQGSHSGRPFNVKTTTFKNSIWNRAHFGNPEFRPEQWCPEEDHTDGRASTRRRRAPKDS